MYFSGNLSINPTQATEIDIIKPTKAFGRILNLITIGALNKKQERETFTAISILQQFNTVFRNLKINNIIRLSYNDLAFYEDKDGVEDDLALALDTFELETDALTSELFKSLSLILEHHDDHFQYLLEVDIKRVHAVGEDPISLKINGLPRELNASESDHKTVKKKLNKDVFANQATHDTYLKTKHVHFDGFVNTLEIEIRKFIHSDSLTSKTNKSMVRPSSKKKTTSHRNEPAPIFNNYPGSGIGDFAYYSLLWSNMSHSHGIHINNTTLVSDEGEELIEIGESGLESSQESILDPNTELDTIKYNSGTDWSDSTETSDFSSFSDDSGSSCSSCSSCGGD